MPISAVNGFDIMGQGNQYFNAGAQLGAMRAPTAGIGDVIRQVMAKATANQDAYAAQGADLMGKTMLYDQTTGKTAQDKLERTIAAQKKAAELPFGGAEVIDVPNPVGPDGKSTGTTRMTRTNTITPEGVIKYGTAYPDRTDELKSKITEILSGNNKTPVGRQQPSNQGGLTPEQAQLLQGVFAQYQAEAAARRANEEPEDRVSNLGFQDLVTGSI